MPAATERIVSVLRAARRSLRIGILPGRVQAIRTAIAVPAPVAGLPPRDKLITITVTTGQIKVIRITVRPMITASRLSSIAQDRGVAPRIAATLHRVVVVLHRPLTRLLRAAPIAAEQGQAQTEDPGEETNGLNKLHVAKNYQDLPGCYRFAGIFLGVRSELRRERFAV